MNKTILSLLVVGIFILSGCSKSEQEDNSTDLPEKLVDRIELVDLEGNRIDMASFKGKTVFLNFWATWCRPCIAEMPDIDSAAKLLSEENFVFLAASDEDLAKIKEFADGLNYSFQFVRSNRSVFDMDIMALPTTFIINPKGEIVYNEVGARKWNSEAELNKLRQLATE